jgi:hypothetical protein
VYVVEAVPPAVTVTLFVPVESATLYVTEYDDVLVKLIVYSVSYVVGVEESPLEDELEELELLDEEDELSLSW